MKVLEPSLTDEELDRVERDTFKYFAEEINLDNGLVPDSTRQGSPSSIAAVGFRANCLSDRGRAQIFEQGRSCEAHADDTSFFS